MREEARKRVISELINNTNLVFNNNDELISKNINKSNLEHRIENLEEYLFIVNAEDLSIEENNTLKSLIGYVFISLINQKLQGINEVQSINFNGNIYYISTANCRLNHVENCIDNMKGRYYKKIVKIAKQYNIDILNSLQYVVNTVIEEKEFSVLYHSIMKETI